ncbi:MAG: non-canonical purine NTP pyrophosphatase [Candidatus Moranbacteria bacterium]|nr:non-canonical purine NTP pyrophosphatase [Candidatus Moranbacteria bacterium]
MRKKIFLATQNEGKIERFKDLIRHTGFDVEVFTPLDLKIEDIEAEENGKTLAENAEIKARAYFGKVAMPILANDTGFFVEGEGLVDAPKRIALAGKNEQTLTKKEIGKALLEFWRKIAKKHGGKVDAAWIEAFVLLDPDGTIHTADSKREVILTDQEFGETHIQMPVRALYISKATNKPAVQHTQKEEQLEMKPIIDALSRLLTTPL